MAECSKTRIMAILLFVLCVAYAVVIAVFIYRELRPRDTSEKKINAENINTFFPAYFRSPEKQRLYEDSYMSGLTNRTLVKPSISDPTKNCNFNCCEVPVRHKRQVASVEHGCCISSVAFMAPAKRVNVNGQERKLLQFATKKQYFAVHSCTALLNCGGCRCSQENGLHVGVAVKDGVVDPDDLDDIELDFFYFDGCCKCING